MSDRRDEPEDTSPYGWSQPDAPSGWDPPGQSQQSYGPSPSSPPPPGPLPGPPPGGYAPPPYVNPALPEHPQATTAMVLGIIGIAVGLATCGLGLLVSPFAWVIGGRALRDIKAEPGRYGGESQARAGHITGIVGTVLLGLAIVVVLLYVVAFAWLVSSSSTSGGVGV